MGACGWQAVGAGPGPRQGGARPKAPTLTALGWASAGLWVVHSEQAGPPSPPGRGSRW